MAEKLKRCNCGGKPKAWDTYDCHWQVECPKCGLRGEAKRIKEEAVESWNEGRTS